MIRIEGEVASAREFAFEDLARLPGQIDDVGTRAAGREGGAVAFRSVLDAVGVAEHASRATLESDDGKFSQEAPLAALTGAVLIYRFGDRPLPREKGGPIRFLIPNLEEGDVAGVDRCTNVKALARIRIG